MFKGKMFLFPISMLTFLLLQCNKKARVPNSDTTILISSYIDTQILTIIANINI